MKECVVMSGSRSPTHENVEIAIISKMSILNSLRRRLTTRLSSLPCEIEGEARSSANATNQALKIPLKKVHDEEKVMQKASDSWVPVDLSEVYILKPLFTDQDDGYLDIHPLCVNVKGKGLYSNNDFAYG
ncbi:hypothetical protein RJT34_23594 [Clitoria ternatea]|uniref:Uncharacterized protein n=1 Tax=Clitoria ternatea TaxID=43366 RepID=A0AAN9FLA8_CLITE